jgi:hypothetical protein
LRIAAAHKDSMQQWKPVWQQDIKLLSDSDSGPHYFTIPSHASGCFSALR